MPSTSDSCHIALHGIHSQYFRLELEKVQDMFYRHVNGILTPFATPVNEALLSAIVQLARGVMGVSEDHSDSCVQKPLVLEGMPLSFHGINWRIARSVWKSMPLSGRHCDRRSCLHGSRRGISHAIWKSRWYQDLLSQLWVMTMTSSA